MKVYEIKLKVFMLKQVIINNIQTVISEFIDSALAKDDELLKMHNDNKFKYYCFGGFYPIEEDKIYKDGNIYTLTLRTIDLNLAQFFNNKLVNNYNSYIKGLTSEIRIVPKKHIEKIYSLTSVILKNDNGYWRTVISPDDFERRLRENLIKKYNDINDEKLNEDFELYTTLEFKNRKPIANEYKGIRLLGDKVSLNISENKTAQDLAYMILGTGLLEMNARGYGFCNYRWL